MEHQQTTTPETSSPPPPKKPQTSYGVLLGLVIIVAAIAGGALYFLNERVLENAALKQNALIETLDAQGTSTEPSAIETDLSAQTPEDFDAEIDAAFGEIDTALKTPQ